MTNIINTRGTKPNSNFDARNFFPCVVQGITRFVEVPIGENHWQQIGWRILEERATTVVMAAIFYGKEGIIARAGFVYNFNNGEIQKVVYQNAVNFDVADPFSFTKEKDRKLAEEARVYIANLISYFKDINDIEYEKAKEARNIRVSQRMAADQFDKKRASKPSTYVEPEYDVSCDKAPVYEGHLATRKSATYTVVSWSQRGHYRTLSSGKEIYIKPMVKHRRKNTP